MIVRIAPSIKQPVRNSYYVSKFSDTTLEFLKSVKPFSSYHKVTQEYEITPDVYAHILEPTACLIDERAQDTVYMRKHLEKYGYQLDAVEFAKKTDNILLNFPQGMGKSLTTMKIIDDLHLRKVLIVCGQGNLQEEWVKDAIKHEYKDVLNFRIVGDDTGASTSRKVGWLDAALKDNAGGVDLINIEALRSEDIVALLNRRCYDCIVVDEVQSAKGWKAQQTEGLHSIARIPGQKRIALSGTPVLNDPLEFFSLLMFLDRLDNTARTTFERYYGDWGFDYWGHYVCRGYQRLDELEELLKPVICWADKSELGLPPKTRRLVNIQFYSLEYNELKRVYKLSDARLKKAGYTSKPQVKSLMQYLSSTAPGKLDFVLEHCQHTRVLVFSQYTTVLDDYCQKLADKGIKVLYYHGKLSMKERLKVLEEWTTGDYQVLLLSIMCARYGLNLQQATEAIFLDIPSSLSILEQAEDRTHRIGQTHPVTSYLLCATDLDESALELIRRKQEELDKLSLK